MKDACDYDALTDPYSGWHMGTCAEQTAKRMAIPRQEQDDYARLSHQRYHAAVQAGIMKGGGQIQPTTFSHCGFQYLGVFDKEMCAVEDLLDHDEESKAHDIGKLDKLPTRWGDTITAGSAAKLADGAAACVMMTGAAMKK